jgi:transcriptional regulator with XRE-family HTH domain
MARDKGETAKVDDTWRAQVESRLRDLGWDRKTFAERAKLSASTVTELLNGVRDGIMYDDLRYVHKVLGFPPPAGPLLPEWQRRTLDVFEGLSEAERLFWVETIERKKRTT